MNRLIAAALTLTFKISLKACVSSLQTMLENRGLGMDGLIASYIGVTQLSMMFVMACVSAASVSLLLSNVSFLGIFCAAAAYDRCLASVVAIACWIF